MHKKPTQKQLLILSGAVALVVLLGLALVRAQEKVALLPAPAPGTSIDGSVPNGGPDGFVETAPGSSASTGAGAPGASFNPQDTVQNSSFFSSITTSIAKVLGAVGDAVVGVFVPSSAPEPADGASSGAQETVSVSAFAGSEPIINLGGTVTSVGSGSIVVETLIPNEGIKTTTVLADAATEISRLVAKDAAVLAAQRAEAAQNGTEPPEPYSRQAVTLADLAVGMLVSVDLAEGTLPGDAQMRAKSIGVLPIVP